MSATDLLNQRGEEQGENARGIATQLEILANAALGSSSTSLARDKRSAADLQSNSAQTKKGRVASSDALDDIDSDDERLIVPDSDDEEPRARPLPTSVFDTSLQIFKDKQQLNPPAWLVNSKYHRVVPLAEARQSAIFSVFTTPLELIICQVVQKVQENDRLIFQVISLKGSSVAQHYRLGDLFYVDFNHAGLSILMLSRTGWLKLVSKVGADMSTSPSFSVDQIPPDETVSVSRAQVVHRQTGVTGPPATLQAKYPATAPLLFHASTETQPAPSAESIGHSFTQILENSTISGNTSFALYKLGIEPKVLDVLSVNPTGKAKQDRSAIRSVQPDLAPSHYN